MDKPTTLKEQLEQIFLNSNQDSSKILKNLKKLLKEAEKAEDVYSIGRINLYIAVCYFDLGIRNKILANAVKAVDIFEKLNDSNMLARSYNLLGIAYRAQGNFQRAIDSYNRSLEAIRGLKKPGIRRDVMLNNIGECYYLMGEYEKSIRIMKDCIALIRRKYPNDHISAVIYAINLSDGYEGLKKYDKSIEALDEVKADAEVLNRDVLLWGYYGRRCCALYMAGSREEAEKYADLTIEAVNNGYDSYEFHRDFEKIASLEIKVGDIKRAQCFADILTKYAVKNGHTLDHGVALGCSDREIESLALRIRDSIRASGYEHAGNPNGQRVTVSIGVANVDGGKSDVTILDLLQFADKALYHAKQQGRDSAFLYCDAEDAAHECLPIVENKQ